MEKEHNSNDLHEEFINLINKIEGDFADFYITKTGKKKLTALVGSKKSKYFDVIGAHSSHSLICYWEFEKGLKIVDQPIVWLDSEGWPNCVFARDLKEFISLLPYDTGSIYDIISWWEHYKEDPESVSIPKEAYTSDDLKKMLASAAGRYGGAHKKFLHLLNKEMNIKTCDDPVGLIGKAMRSHPDLSKWLENLN